MNVDKVLFHVIPVLFSFKRRASYPKPFENRNPAALGMVPGNHFWITFYHSRLLTTPDVGAPGPLRPVDYLYGGRSVEGVLWTRAGGTAGDAEG